MGAQWSSADIDEPFAHFQQWEHGHSVAMLKKYQVGDFDFGIDGKTVAFTVDESLFSNLEDREYHSARDDILKWQEELRRHQKEMETVLQEEVCLI